MIARLAVALGLAAALFAFERSAPRAQAPEPAIERIVPRVEAQDWKVAALTLAIAGKPELVYLQRGGAWRCASAFGAVALASEVEAVAGGIVEAIGELRTDDPARQLEYGFGAADTLRVALHGPGFAKQADRDELVALEIGRALPGVGGGRSFVRRSGTSAVLEIQRDPRALLHSKDGLPPLLDRRVLAGEWPQAGEGVARAFVDFEGGRSIELVVRRTPREKLLPGQAPEEWIAIEGGEESVCLPYRVAAWQSFLFHVGYLGFADPREAPRLGLEGEPRARVSLFLTRGDPIELAVGRPNANRQSFVANRKTGMLCLVAPEHAPLFAPTVDMLCETSMPNPWEEWLSR